MRYCDAGDYQFVCKKCGNVLQILVADTGNQDYNFLVAIHELIESYLLNKRGVDFKVVDRWDIEHQDSPEPGRLKGCPYRKEHLFATKIEKVIAKHLKVNWEKYDNDLEKFLDTYGKV